MSELAVKNEGMIKVGTFSEGQRRHLEFHRNDVFLEARGGAVAT